METGIAHLKRRARVVEIINSVFDNAIVLQTGCMVYLPELGKRDIHCIWPILLLEAQEQMLQHQLKSTYCYAQLLKTSNN